MKNYNKTYENVFSTDREKSSGRLYPDKITVGDMELDKYILTFKDFMKDFYLDMFNGCVKLSWLRRKFSYYGKKTILPMNKNSLLVNIAFVKFLRRMVGNDIQILTRGKFFTKLELYFDELFSGFEEGNPFENPDYYKFPFENISIDFLIAVYQLDDRIELLKKADKDKMSYAVFLDYVINHVYSINEEIGRDRYQLRHNKDRNFPFCVIDTDKTKK
jgi:hypothetical protein